MKFNWKWFIVIGFLLVLLIVPMIWGFWMMPYGGYGMMRGYGYQMPMMNYGFGYGMMPFFGMGLMWLTSIGILILIGLGIVWLLKQITIKTE